MEINTKNQVSEDQKKNNVNKILVIIVALLTVLCGILFWQVLEQKKAVSTEVAEKQEVVEEKDALGKELENMLEQYEGMQSDNKQMQSQIDEQKDKIAELLKDVEKHKGNTSLMLKYKKETETLRKIMQGFVVTIDSLNTLAQNLRVERDEVKSELGNQKNKYDELHKEKDNLSQKVYEASVLTALSPSATGVFFRSNGKEVESNKAKKIEKIKTCFDLSENKISKKGPKDVFVRILSPDGKVMAEGADESFMFSFDGVKGLYSAKKTIEYSGQKMTVCTYFSSDKFPEGKYVAEIYADKTKIGDINFELK